MSTPRMAVTLSDKNTATEKSETKDENSKDIKKKLQEAHSIIFDFELPADLKDATDAQKLHGQEIKQIMMDKDIPRSFALIAMKMASLDEKVSDEQVQYFLDKHAHMVEPKIYKAKCDQLWADLRGQDFTDYLKLSVGSKNEAIISDVQKHNLMIATKIKNKEVTADPDVLADVNKQLIFEALMIINYKHKETSAQSAVLGKIAEPLGIRKRAHVQIEKLAAIEAKAAANKNIVDSETEANLNGLLKELAQDKLNTNAFRRLTVFNPGAQKANSAATVSSKVKQPTDVRPPSPQQR